MPSQNRARSAGWLNKNKSPVSSSHEFAVGAIHEYVVWQYQRHHETGFGVRARIGTDHGLAAVSWTSLDSVVQRSERMTDVNDLTHTLTDLRGTPAVSTLNGGAAEADKVQQQIRVLAQRQQEMLPHFQNPRTYACSNSRSS